MSVTAENALVVRRAMTAKTETITDLGFVIPAPMKFADKDDYWAAVNGTAINTKTLLDRTNIAFCQITWIRRNDESNPFCPDRPISRYTYNAYIFRQYRNTRSDESETPDPFLEKSLLYYDKYEGAVLDLWEEFLGTANIVGLAEGCQATIYPMTQPDFSQNTAVCEPILSGDIFGFSTNLQSEVEIGFYG